MLLSDIPPQFPPDIVDVDALVDITEIYGNPINNNEMKKKKKKTIFFEDRYGVNIDDLHSTNEVDAIIELKIGRKLKIINIEDSDK
jgi:hypothetical protein